MTLKAAKRGFRPLDIVTLAPVGLLFLAGCGAVGSDRPPVGSAPTIPIVGGLERVMGRDAAALVRQFGDPQLDVREGTARKLQFSNATCVLDTYLYPKGAAEPVVTYIDTRQSDGSPIDRASCVGALAAGKRK